ncbi:hypothetical protein HJC54_01275 [Burkholderia glumae]|nr:hypothetical protein HJC54_01275 [Burkholderia glumae]
MSSTRTNVKKKRRIAAAAIALLVLVAGAATLTFWGNHDYTDCQRHNYNSKLNGGLKEFDGKKYTINICGSGTNNSHFFGDSFDAVVLTITNEQGDVVAKRRYKVFWDGVPGHEPLAIGKNSITYQDDEEQADHTITMPPGFIDRIRARLPFFN